VEQRNTVPDTTLMLKTVLTRGLEILMPNLSKRYGFPSRIAKKVVKKWDPSINYYSNGNFPPPSFHQNGGPGCPPRTEIYVPEHGILGFTVPAWENGHFGQIWTVQDHTGHPRRGPCMVLYCPVWSLHCPIGSLGFRFGRTCPVGYSLK
jgi:hypothetical protein